MSNFIFSRHRVNKLSVIPEVALQPLPSEVTEEEGENDDGKADASGYEQIGKGLEMNDYQALMEAALYAMADIMLKEFDNDMVACLEAVEFVFSIDCPLAWLPCLVFPPISTMDPPREILVAVLKNFCRIRHVLLSPESASEGNTNFDWTHVTDHVDPCKLSQMEFFKILVRFNRMQHVNQHMKFESDSAEAIVWAVECAIRLNCDDCHAHDVFVRRLPAYPE